LLKIALLYGANASGKTTVLKALDFLRVLVLQPLNKKSDVLDFEPFLFVDDPLKENSKISIEFIQNGKRYSYKVVFSKEAVIHEELTFWNSYKANIYKRYTDTSKQLSEIEFGSTISVDSLTKKALETNTLWNNTVLGGFLKTNINIKELKEVVDWFGSTLMTTVQNNSILTIFASDLVEKKRITNMDIVNIIKRADSNISDIIVEDEEVDLREYLDEPFHIVRKKRSNNEIINSEKFSDKFMRRNIAFEHSVENKNYRLPFEMESSGTQRFYGLAGILALLIRESVILPIDELEASLHPDLYKYFILTFLLNTNGSQLIATTHNREILNDRDLFRDDAIWFTNKDDTGNTELYSLADFDSSVIRNTSNVLNAYKTGKLGAIPYPGDYYLNLTP